MVANKRVEWHGPHFGEVVWINATLSTPYSGKWTLQEIYTESGDQAKDSEGATVAETPRLTNSQLAEGNGRTGAVAAALPFIRGNA